MKIHHLSSMIAACLVLIFFGCSRGHIRQTCILSLGNDEQDYTNPVESIDTSMISVSWWAFDQKRQYIFQDSMSQDSLFRIKSNDEDTRIIMGGKHLKFIQDNVDGPSIIDCTNQGDTLTPYDFKDGIWLEIKYGNKVRTIIDGSYADPEIQATIDSIQSIVPLNMCERFHYYGPDIFIVSDIVEMTYCLIFNDDE